MEKFSLCRQTNEHDDVTQGNEPVLSFKLQAIGSINKLLSILKALMNSNTRFSNDRSVFSKSFSIKLFKALTRRRNIHSKRHTSRRGGGRNDTI